MNNKPLLLKDLISHIDKHMMKGPTDMKVTKIIQKNGYVIKWLQEDTRFGPQEVVLAYSPEGWLIGSENTAKALCETWGIKPEKAAEEDAACNIGYCFRERRWYGWDEQHIQGFGVGDIVLKQNANWFDIDSLADLERYRIGDLEEARTAAIEYVRSLSNYGFL